MPAIASVHYAPAVIRQRPAGTSLEVAATWLLDLTSRAAGASPARTRYLLADLVAGLVVLGASGMRRQAEHNFAQALRLSPASPRARQLARASIHSFARMAIDFLWLRTLSDAEVRAVASVTGTDHLEQALRRSRGVIFVLPHLGCWDVAAARASAANLPVTIVAEDTWAARLVAGSRLRPNVQLVSRQHSLRPLLRALGRNEAVALLSDLARPGLETVEVPFFGQPAPMPSGPARLALRTSAPLVVVASVRTAAGRYRVELQPPVSAADSETESESARQAVVADLTARLAAGFERVVLTYPDQWYPFGTIWPDTRGRSLAITPAPAALGGRQHQPGLGRSTRP